MASRPDTVDLHTVIHESTAFSPRAGEKTTSASDNSAPGRKSTTLPHFVKAASKKKKAQMNKPSKAPMKTKKKKKKKKKKNNATKLVKTKTRKPPKIPLNKTADKLVEGPSGSIGSGSGRIPGRIHRAELGGMPIKEPIDKLSGKREPVATSTVVEAKEDVFSEKQPASERSDAGTQTPEIKKHQTSDPAFAPKTGEKTLSTSDNGVRRSPSRTIPQVMPIEETIDKLSGKREPVATSTVVEVKEDLILEQKPVPEHRSSVLEETSEGERIQNSGDAQEEESNEDQPVDTKGSKLGRCGMLGGGGMLVLVVVALVRLAQKKKKNKDEHEYDEDEDDEDEDDEDEDDEDMSKDGSEDNEGEALEEEREMNRPR